MGGGSAEAVASFTRRAFLVRLSKICLVRSALHMAGRAGLHEAGGGGEEGRSDLCQGVGSL